MNFPNERGRSGGSDIRSRLSTNGDNKNNNSSRRSDNDDFYYNDDEYGESTNYFNDDTGNDFNNNLDYNSPRRLLRAGSYDNGEVQYNTNDNALSSYSKTSTSSDAATATSTFYSRKSIVDIITENSNNNSHHHNNINGIITTANKEGKVFFQHLCTAASISRPSRIQSLSWPHLLQGESCVIADQTGSGKTLAYLLPSLYRLYQQQQQEQQEKRQQPQRSNNVNGRPRIVILAPTAELADQIHRVCVMLSENLKSIPSTASSTTTSTSSSSPSSSPSSQQWTFRPFVTTAAGSRVTNIRDQIRLLQGTPIDVLISTPGRLSTILRTRNSGLDLGEVLSLVLDEVDFLLVDESFGPQLRAVGAAVRRNEDIDDDDDDNNYDVDDNGKEVGEDEKNTNSPNDIIAATAATRSKTQFIFVTATLPTDVLDVIRAEVPNITEVRGPGLHRITPAVQQTLVDVSVPASMNRDAKAGFDFKVRELLRALRARRVDRTLVFCNTVEACRDVENALKRNDRGGRRCRVWAYHNALSPENRLKNLHSFSSTSSSREGYDKSSSSSRGGSSSSSSSGGDGGSGVYAESVLVCTDRAARGVDFESNPVDHVILFDFPKDPAEYVRRVGRTARAGRAGASTVLAYGWQLPIARQIMGLGGGSGGGNDKKKGKGNRGNAKLEGFNMMKSDDGWDDELNDTKDDEYFVKGGARKRKEQGSAMTSSTPPNKKNVVAVSSKEKVKRTKSTDDGIGKSR